MVSPEPGMVSPEPEPRVSYDTIGGHLRPILVNPRYEPLARKSIEQVFGLRPDTLN